MQLSITLSTRLTTTEELRVAFDKTASTVCSISIPWRGFLQYFTSVKARITMASRVSSIGPGNSAVFPVLEEIELGKNPLLTYESRL
jgi:hypothetical protein